MVAVRVGAGELVHAAASSEVAPESSRERALRAAEKLTETLPCMAWSAAAISRFGRKGSVPTHVALADPTGSS